MRSVFSSFGVTTQQWLDGFSPTDVFAVLLINSDTPRKLFCPLTPKKNKIGDPKCPFFEQKFRPLPSSDGRCVEMRRNSGKTKSTNIITISRLPSHTSLVKFGLGNLSYRGVINCVFLQLSHSASFDWQYLERQHIQNYQSQFADS